MMRTIAWVASVLTRKSMRRSAPSWRTPLAIALSALTLALATTLPPLDSTKLRWPWSSWRPEIVALVTNADAAADRLGLPRGRELTGEEIRRWWHAAPIGQKFEFPFIHETVEITVVDPWSRQRLPKGTVWMWWSSRKWRTFGPMDVTRMSITYASD
jgi:hypothetical protein